MDAMERRFQEKWDEIAKRLDRTVKQSEVVELMNGKQEAFGLQMKDMEQRMKELMQARVGELREESDFRNRKIVKSVEEVGEVAHRTEMQMLESKDSVRSLQGDYHALLRFMNEFKARLGYFEWTGEEIKQLKRRQLKLIERLAPEGEA